MQIKANINYELLVNVRSNILSTLLYKVLLILSFGATIYYASIEGGDYIPYTYYFMSMIF